ncbi:hypothetical protein MRX96_022159 [Rhipicephalus microplus]
MTKTAIAQTFPKRWIRKKMTTQRSSSSRLPPQPPQPPPLAAPQPPPAPIAAPEPPAFNAVSNLAQAGADDDPMGGGGGWDASDGARGGANGRGRRGSSGGYISLRRPRVLPPQGVPTQPTYLCAQLAVVSDAVTVNQHASIGKY